MKNNQLPIVAVVGRPNVGKSSLFNRLLSRKVAITHEESGTTRDRHYREIEWNSRMFMLVDTGGLVHQTQTKVDRHIREQVQTAVEEADLVLLVVDGQAGITDLDLTIVRDLRKYRKKIILVANKVDNKALHQNLSEFQRLGFGEPFPVTASHGTGTGDLLDLVVSRLPVEGGSAAPASIKIAILGRPNAGKSTLVNRLLGEERVITDEVPGTTRDSVDSWLIWEGTRFCLIDTAGLRKKSKSKETIEYVSTLHSERSLERCDVVLLLVDAKLGVDEQDIRIAQNVLSKGRPLVLCLNKWDLIPDKESKTFDHAVKEIKTKAMFLPFMPIISFSALSGQRASKVLEIARDLNEKQDIQFAPQDLKAFMESIAIAHGHPSVYGHAVLFESIWQTGCRPFTFKIKTNFPEDIKESYVRYMENCFYDRFKMIGCPVRFRFVSRTRRKAEEEE